MVRLCVILLFLLVNVEVGNGNLPCTEAPTTIIKPARITVEEKIVGVLQDSGYTVRMQEIILAQAIHESGHFTNRLSRKWNNVFAIYNSPFDTLAIGNWGEAEGKKGWEVYNNVEDATRAYILYTKGRGYPQDTTLTGYVKFLQKKVYFYPNEEKDRLRYHNALNTIIKNYVRTKDKV